MSARQAGAGRAQAVSQSWWQAAADGRPWLVAHRCGAGEAPENSMAALERCLAIAQGNPNRRLAAVEVDVRMTADGSVVVFHDEDCRRLAGEASSVRELTHKRLKELLRAAGAEPPPSLQEVCEALAPSALGIFVEIKDAAATEPASRILIETGLRQRCVVGSFDEAVVRAIGEAGELPAVWLFEEAVTIERALSQDGQMRGSQNGQQGSSASGLRRRVPPRVPAGASGRVQGRVAAGVPLGPCGKVAVAGLERHLVTAETVRRWHELGAAVWVWTVNEPDEARGLAQAGVDAIITDWPQRFLSELSCAP